MLKSKLINRVNNPLLFGQIQIRLVKFSLTYYINSSLNLPGRRQVEPGLSFL